MDYLKYHMDSAALRDIDPANDCLRYVCERFELTMEQRYWIAFLYSTCYSGATTFYMYNEFPDFENVSVDRLSRWWKSNKDKCVFQTDRLRIKTTNQFVPSFESYKKFIGEGSQAEKFYTLKTPYSDMTYNNAYSAVQGIRNIGRFTTFIYLEMLNTLTDFNCVPDRIDWAYADNCRKGLCKAIGVEDNSNYAMLDKAMNKIITTLVKKKCLLSNIYNVETTLCAYEKHTKGQRYVGYYLERQRKEFDKMSISVTKGVCWDVLYQFENETYKK